MSNLGSASGGTHRRSRSWQQQQAALQQADLDPEGSRHSESRLSACTTAKTGAPAVLGKVVHAPASPLAGVRQHLRRISTQSLSGFSDASGTASSGGGARGGHLVNAGAAPPFLQGSGPASQAGLAGLGMHGGRAEQGYHEGQGFCIGALDTCLCTHLGWGRLICIR